MGVKDRPQCYFDVEINREPGKMWQGFLFGCSEIVLCEGQTVKSSFDWKMLKILLFDDYLCMFGFLWFSKSLFQLQKSCLVMQKVVHKRGSDVWSLS